MSREARMLTQG